MVTKISCASSYFVAEGKMTKVGRKGGDRQDRAQLFMWGRGLEGGGVAAY